MSSATAAGPSAGIAPDVRWRIIAVFALQGVVPAMLNMRLPDLQLRAGLSEAGLGLVLMGGSIGALASFAVATRALEALGSRRLTIISYVLCALAAVGVASVTSGLSMFAFLAIVGATASLANIAINVEADRVEVATDRRVMNTCHGVWSVAFFLASTIAGLARGAGMDPVLHLWLLAPTYILATLVLALPMSECPARPFGGAARRRFVWPTMAVLSLVAFGLGADLLDGAARIWATIYLRDAFDVSALLESMALPALFLAMAGGRLVADPWIDRLGPARVGQAALSVALVGLVVLVIAPTALVAIFGFALVGLGVSVIYPLMISGAARLGDRPAAENVAATTLLFQIIMLAAPVLIGTAAEALGLRTTFAFLLPLLVLGWIMAGRLR
jgi:MFS family permease